MSAQKSTPFRLAAIDIDGTLLGPDSQLSGANIDAVAKLQALGIRVILASGRRHENMLRFHHLLRLEGPVVSCQGALVKIAETGEILHRHCIPADLAALVVRDGEAAGMTLIYYRADGIFISEKNSLTDLYHSRGGDELTVADLPEKFVGDSPLKIIWMNFAARIAERFPDIEKRYRDRLDTLVTYPEYLEFIAPGVSKAVGIEAVAKYYGIDRGEVLAFGDGNNDVPMLQWAGMGVAMSESTPAAKAAAARIAPPGDAATSLARAVDDILG
jgi:hypothetical protein